jgi:hypothetical protein
MTDAQIVATYSDAALSGIIRDLPTCELPNGDGRWWPRFEAALHEQNIRRIHESQQDTESQQ